MTAAAADLAAIDSALEEIHQLVAPAILTMSPAAADEVSSAIAQLFSEHARDYQTVASAAANYQERFVQNLTASSAAYASAEEAIASLLQGLNSTVADALDWATQALNVLIPTDVAFTVVGLIFVAGLLTVLSLVVLINLPAAAPMLLSGLIGTL